MADEDTTKGTDEGAQDADKSQDDKDAKAQDAKGTEGKDTSQDLDTIDQLPQWAKDLVSGLRKENAGHRQAKKKAESEAQDATRKADEEQGKFKELYEAEQAKTQAAEAKAASLELDALKAKVATAAKLPAGLASRLQGETEDELTEDAKLILAELPKPSMETDGGKGTGGGDGGQADMTDEEKHEFAAVMGIDPEFVKAEAFQLPKK